MSVPVRTSAEFDGIFVDPDGSQRCESLSSCWMVPFERALQVRAFSWTGASAAPPACGGSPRHRTTSAMSPGWSETR
jgi:hypothetical protein